MKNNPSAKFTFLRHGQVKGAPALYGHTNVEVTQEGLASMRQVIEPLHAVRPIDKVVSSPLLRCALFAETFAEEQELDIVLDPRLSEMNFGRWDGIPFDRMRKHWNKLDVFRNNPYRITPPGGEGLKPFASRVESAWQELIKENKGQHYLVVCHAGVIRIIIASVLGLEIKNPLLFSQLKIDYASITRIEVAQAALARPRVCCINTQYGGPFAEK